MADHADEMRLRAAQVEISENYLGFFEWVVWSVLRHARILMLFGSRAFDVGLMFAPELLTNLPSETRSTLRVVACQVDDGGCLLSAVVPGSLRPLVNHFVIGIPLSPDDAVASSLESPSASLLQSTTKRETAVAAAQRAGWGIKLTNATGDCAPDTMTYFQKIERNLETWKLVRKEIAEKIRSVADDVSWNQVFRCCCEEEDKDLEGIVNNSLLEFQG